MAEEVAALGLKVDPSGLQVGIDKLQELTEVAPQAEKALDGTATSAARASKSLATLGSGSGASLNEFAGNAKKASDSTASLGKASDSAGIAQAKFDQAIRSSMGGLNTFGDSADRAARSATALGQANTSSSAAFGVMSRAAVAAGGAITAALSVNALKNYADGWSDMRSKVGAATGDMAGAGDTMQRLVDIAQASYSPLQQTVDIYARNVSTFRDMGRSAAEAADFTESLNNMLVLTATRGQQAASVQDALAKAMAVGNLQADGLETILANAGEVAQALAKELNTNVSSLRSFASQGKITGDVIARAIIKPVDEVRQRAAEMAATITDAFGNLGTSVLSIVGQLDQATGASSSVAEAIGKISEAIKGSGDAIINFGKEARPVFEVIAFGAATAAVALGSRLTVEAGKAGAAMAVAAAQALRMQAATVALAASAGPAAIAMGALGTATRLASTAMAALGGPVGLVLTVLGTAAAAFYTFRDSSKSASDALIAMGDPIDGVIDKLTTMSEVQRRTAETSLLADQAQNVKAAEAAYNDFYTAVMNAAAASRMNSQEMQQLGDDLDKARAAGDSFIPIIERISNAKYVPAGTQQELEGLAAGFDTASQAIATAAEWLAKFRDAAASTPVAGAADSSANLIKQLQAETNAMLQGATAYKSKEQAMRELKATQDTYTAQLQKLVDAGEGASDNANRLRDAIKGIGERMTGTATSTRTAASAYDSWTNSIQQKTAALREELNGSNKLTESQKLMIRLETELATGKLKVSAATAAKIKTDIQELAGLEKLRKETELNVRAYQEWVALQQEMSDESVKLSKAREELQQWTFKENEALKDSARVLQVQAANIGATDKQRQLALATIQSEIQLEKELEDIKNANIEGGEKSRDEERAQARLRHAERIAQAEAQIYINEMDKASQTIGQTLQDYIMGGGKDAAQYLKRLFANLVLQPVVNVLAGGISGLLGGSGQGGGAGGGGFMSQLQNAGGGFTNWGGWGGNLSSGIGNLGNSIGGGLGESLVSLGSTVSEFDAWLSKVPGFEGGIGSAAGYAGAIFQLFQGNYGSGIGSAIGTAIMPGIGTMIGGLIGGWIDGLDGSGDPHRGAVGHYQTGYGGENYAAGVTDYDADIGMGLQVFAAAIGGSFESFLASFGQSARVDVAANWADDFDGEGESWGGFVLQMQDALGEWKTLVDWSADGVGRFGQARDFGPGEEGYAEFITAVSQSYVEALKQVDLPEWASGMLDSIASDASIETIATTLNQLAVMRETLAGWQTYLVEFANVGDAAFGALLESMGGFENLSAGVSSFVDLYYSEQEKLELQQKQLTDQLAAMNVELPASKDAWRELVDSALAAGEGGAELAALLLSLGPAFAEYADGAEAAVQAQIDAQQAVIDALYSDAGISGDTIAQILRDGMLGRLTQEDVGAQLSSHIIDGIYNSIAGGFAQQITDTFTSGIITPLLQAAATGSAMSGVVSQASIDAVVGQARASVAALQAILNDPALQQAIADINATISGLSIGAPNVKPVATVTKPRYSGGGGGYGGAASSINAAAGNFARIAESLQDVIDRWRLDVLGSSEAAQANLEAEFAILTAQARAGDEDAASKLPDIMSKLLQYTKENSETLHEQMLAQIKYMNSLDETSKIVAGLGGSGAEAARKLSADYEFLSGATGTQYDLSTRDFTTTAVGALTRGMGVDDLIKRLDNAAEISAASVRNAYEVGNISKEDLQSAFLNSYQSSLQQFETTLLGGLLGSKGYGEYAPAFSNEEYAVLLSKLNDLYAAADLDRNATIGMTVHPEFNEIWKKLFGFSEVGAIGSDQQEAIKRWKEIQKQLSSIASFDVGTARVPSTGLAVLHKDERVLTAMENDVMVRSVQGINQGWQSLVNGIEAMRAELAEAKAELQAIRSSSEETAGYTRNTSHTLDEVTNGGEAMEITGEVKVAP